MNAPIPAGIYLTGSDPRPPVAHDKAGVVREAASVIAARGFALTPPTPPLCHGAAPRVLTTAAIARHAPLRAIRDALPADLRLVVVVWADNASVITSVPRDAPWPPPAEWLESAYRAAARQPRSPPGAPSIMHGFAPRGSVNGVRQ